ncbi:MAG: hypothetical protein ACRENH_16030 [Gemmatimonadaceae bacterium]|jgi:hypothetical protein
MMRARTQLLFGAATLVAALTLVSVPRAGTQNVLGECGLTFDDPGALGAISDQAALTFAPGFRMHCSTHFLNVDPLNVVGHFHLPFEDESIACAFAEAGGITGFGKDDGNGGCVAVDWDHEPRFLLSHVQDQWIKVWMEDASSHQPRAFDARRVSVSAGHPIQLWFRKQDGTWWFWNQLNGAKNWKVEQWAKDVMEVRIRGTNSGFGSYGIRTVYVKE